MNMNMGKSIIWEPTAVKSELNNIKAEADPDVNHMFITIVPVQTSFYKSAW